MVVERHDMSERKFVAPNFLTSWSCRAVQVHDSQNRVWKPPPGTSSWAWKTNSNDPSEKNKRVMLACSEICFHVCINPSEVERIREVQRVSSCVWLTFVAVAFTCRLMFERFQTRSGCTMSQYPSDFFYVSLSSGPWLNPCWGLVCLNLSCVNGHAGWWCRLCLRKKMNKNLPLTQTTESAQDSGGMLPKSAGIILHTSILGESQWKTFWRGRPFHKKEKKTC